MSWQEYIDSGMIETGHLTDGAILGLDGSIWASSSNLKPSKEEGLSMVQSFSDPTAIRTKGIVLLGQKYIPIKADDRSIYGKKPNGGIVAVKTKKCVLIGAYGEGQQPGDAAKTVEDLADYLLGSGL